MSRPKVYIDGKEGTTGLQIYDRLAAREDIDLLLIGEEKRKDPSERKKFLNEADLVFLCLPDALKAAGRVANPGCYATGFLSLVRPLVEKGALSPKARLTCHALSGYTGAGKKAVAQYTDPDRAEELESPRHYAVTLSHKHLPEMAAVAGLDRPPLFTPMICDYPQGMVVTVPLWAEGVEGAQSVESLRALYADYYAGSPVVTLRPADAPSCGFIGANNLAGTDGLQIFVNGNREQLMLSARLDNLGKGASGAAVQNMNLMLGFEETAGLEL